MSCAPEIIFGGTGGVGSHFLFVLARTIFRRYRGRRESFSCFVPGVIVVGTDGVPSRFYVFLSQTCFLWYRGRRVPFACFALPDTFSAVPRASGPVFMFCAPGHIFGGTEGFGSLFHVLRYRTRFRRYRGRRFPFSCFALPDSFSTMPWASGPIFMFCVPETVFNGTEGVGSRFHVFRSRTRFRRYRGPRVPFSCFARPD
jgi:hypothetical protein